MTALAVAMLASVAQAAPAQDDPAQTSSFAYKYFPTGDPDDGRFLLVAGWGLETLADEKVSAYIGVPRDRVTYCFGVFDGDVGGNWDIQRDGADSTLFTLFSDPLRDGAGTRMVSQISSVSMTSDAWSDTCASVDADARAPSGHYFYRLEVAWASPGIANDLNAFKLRSDAEVSLAVQKFGVIGAPNNLGVDPAVGTGDANPGPDANDAGANSYDGSWEFHLYAGSPAASLVVRDGDFDRGDDSDDADTPNVDPDGAGPAAAEGGRPGQPADDTSPMTDARVPGMVSYAVASAAGRSWSNDNPSGNTEWERFEIVDPSGADLPAGFYSIRIAGMDAHNAVYLEPPGDVYSTPEKPLPVRNEAPVAAAGADRSGSRLDTFTLDGTGSRDLDGTIVSYDWAFGDGSSANGAMVDHRYNSLGVFVAVLTVTDDMGATGADQVEVTIANLAPIAAAGPDRSGTRLDNFQFDGSASDDLDGAVTSWTWDFGDGTGAAGMTASHSYTATGSFTVRLTVVDSDGGTGVDSAQVNINNIAPVAVAPVDRTLFKFLPATIYGYGSFDSDGTIVSYDWDFGDGQTGTGSAVSPYWSAVGVYTVRLTVTDDDGAIHSDTMLVTIVTRPPVAVAGPDVSTFDGTSADFDGTASYDQDGSLVSFWWDFGDGTGTAGAIATHRYTKPGSYTATLTVTDDDGATSSDSRIIDVVQTPASPPLSEAPSTGSETAVDDELGGTGALGPALAMLAGLGGAGVGVSRLIRGFRMR